MPPERLESSVRIVVSITHLRRQVMKLIAIDLLNWQFSAHFCWGYFQNLWWAI